ncbi:hypothetical protein E2C01_077931 [Portunus trituberculatus]|uniref:Uncharacterized protein n=1 Tax=Portunus trituberculatus TaxID=210409 RepID=A0A5B7INN7_PORTR|nr:hypothetical protein [Portunus trituberculatus]
MKKPHSASARGLDAKPRTRREEGKRRHEIRGCGPAEQQRQGREEESWGGRTVFGVGRKPGLKADDTRAALRGRGGGGGGGRGGVGRREGGPGKGKGKMR